MEWTVSSHYYHYFASAIAQETAVGFEHNAKWQSLELFLFIRLTTLWRDEFWQGFVLNSTSLTSISATDQQSCYCHVWRGKRRGNVEILHLLLWDICLYQSSDPWLTDCKEKGTVKSVWYFLNLYLSLTIHRSLSLYYFWQQLSWDTACPKGFRKYKGRHVDKSMWQICKLASEVLYVDGDVQKSVTTLKC